MKKILFILFISFFTSSLAQKELWAVNSGRDQVGTFQQVYFGNITKYDLNGENPTIMHEFNGFNGYRPEGKLFQASNGKLYGTTVYGGSSFIPNTFTYGYGILFEYDLILNKYIILKNFIYDLSAASRPIVGVIEPFPGVLFGIGGAKFFKYDSNTTIFTSIINGGINFDGVPLFFNSELMKASDNNLYTTAQYSGGICGAPIPSPYLKGAIIKLNTTTNIVSATTYSCNVVDYVGNPRSKFFEVSPGKLIGLGRTANDYLQPDGSILVGNGSIFEYDIYAGISTLKKDFFPNTTGQNQSEMCDGGDGYFYGVCETSTKLTTCTSPPAPPDSSFPLKGTIWKYNPITNELTVIKEIGTCDGIDPTQIQYPTSIFKTSLGNFICTNTAIQNVKAYFKYDPVSNLATVPVGVWPPLEDLNPANFIEICRKPSYQEILVNTYTPEVGSTFTYNINNTNATTYVWQKGTIVLPLQTTGILTLTNVTNNATGVYTCAMTNECGTTVTANLNINVSNLGTDTIDNYKQQITLYPNPTKGSINLKFPENRGLKGIKYKIINLLGQVIQEKNIGNLQNKSEVTIDSSLFTTGVYQVTLTTDKGDWNGKFVKE